MLQGFPPNHQADDESINYYLFGTFSNTLLGQTDAYAYNYKHIILIQNLQQLAAFYSESLIAKSCSDRPIMLPVSHSRWSRTNTYKSEGMSLAFMEKELQWMYAFLKAMSIKWPRYSIAAHVLCCVWENDIWYMVTCTNKNRSTFCCCWIHWRADACVCVCACVRACVRACVHACVRACVRTHAFVYVCVRACVFVCVCVF